MTGITEQGQDSGARYFPVIVVNLRNGLFLTYFLPPVRKRNRRNYREQRYLFHLVAFFVIVPRIEAVIHIIHRKIPAITFPGILPLHAVRKIVFVSKTYSVEF